MPHQPLIWSDLLGSGPAFADTQPSPVPDDIADSDISSQAIEEGPPQTHASVRNRAGMVVFACPREYPATRGERQRQTKLQRFDFSKESLAELFTRLCLVTVDRLLLVTEPDTRRDASGCREMHYHLAFAV